MYPPVPPPPPPPGGPRGLEEQPEASFMVMVLNVTNTITHLCLGAAACVAFVIANIAVRGNFATHMYLCTFGYVILLAVGFLAFDPSSNLRRSLQYPKKKLIHLLLQFAGSSLAIAGSLIGLIDNPNRLNNSHGYVGLFAMILTFLSLIGGVVNFRSSEKNNRALITTLHTCLGTVTIILAFVALCLGFDMVAIIIGDRNRNFAIAVTSIGLFGFVLPPFLNMYYRLRN